MHAPVLASSLYSALAISVLFLHALFILWVVFGALVTRSRTILRWLHVGSLVWGILIRDVDPEVCSRLLELGTIEVKPEAWLKLPQRESASSHESKYDQQLATCGKAGVIEEILLLDSARSVRFYPGRWVRLKKQSGQFIARRPQPYGADLWCYVGIHNGIVTQLLDLPLTEHKWRPCDEAWHLQQAKDAARGEPQVFRVREGSIATECTVDFFSPAPMWARRRWDHVGRPTRNVNCLFSYTFPSEQFQAEMTFAQETMWMVRQDESKGPHDRHD